jgi:predicted anti-sigma-YlaC factor YlaD
MHISCQEVVELVTDYLDGALATEEGALFEQHLNFCDGCELYLDQMRSTVAALGRIEETDLPPAMRERLLVAFRDRRPSAPGRWLRWPWPRPS